MENQDYLFVFINDGWWLKLTSVDEIFNYHELTGSRWGNALCDYVNSDIKKEQSQNKIVQTMILKADGKHTAPDLLNGMRAEIMRNQINTLLENGYVHINRVGGYCSVFDEADEKQFVRRKKLIFPTFKESDIRITTWGEEGKHFYAYIDDMQVYDGDKIKWDTHEEAYAFAKQFVSELR